MEVNQHSWPCFCQTGPYHKATVRQHSGDETVPQGGQSSARPHSIVGHHLPSLSLRAFWGFSEALVCLLQGYFDQYTGTSHKLQLKIVIWLSSSISGLLCLPVLLLPELGGPGDAAPSVPSVAGGADAAKRAHIAESEVSRDFNCISCGEQKAELEL